MYCYVPMVALADCGNRVLSSELFGGPHQGVFMSGNVHELRNSSLHHLVQGASDSGAVYTGREFTYQGSVIDGNEFKHINSLDGKSFPLFPPPFPLSPSSPIVLFPYPPPLTDTLFQGETPQPCILMTRSAGTS